MRAGNDNAQKGTLKRALNGLKCLQSRVICPTYMYQLVMGKIIKCFINSRLPKIPTPIRIQKRGRGWGHLFFGRFSAWDLARMARVSGGLSMREVCAEGRKLSATQAETCSAGSVPVFFKHQALQILSLGQVQHDRMVWRCAAPV
jgi:hypothetical protein